MKFYIDEKNNLLTSLNGEKVSGLQEVIPNMVDASKEKHLPVVNINNNEMSISVGGISHPMEEKHYIGWIIVEMNNGFKKIDLTNENKITIKISDYEKVQTVYAYCNLHGIWKTEINY